MARMRWMREDETSPATMVCLNCDTEVAEDPTRVFYCYCRSGGVAGDVVENPLATRP